MITANNECGEMSKNIFSDRGCTEQNIVGGRVLKASREIKRQK